MATEEEGPLHDLSVLRAMLHDECALAGLSRGTFIYVFIGDFADPTTLSAVEFGEFLGYDAQRKEVHYRILTDPSQLKRPASGIGLRAMLTDEQSGLLLPEGARTPQAQEKRILLDEDYIILNGLAFAKYLANAAEQHPGDDLYG